MSEDVDISMSAAEDWRKSVSVVEHFEGELGSLYGACIKYEHLTGVTERLEGENCTTIESSQSGLIHTSDTLTDLVLLVS